MGDDADKPKLTYFAGWGLAEQARWMLGATLGADGWTQRALQEHAEFVELRESGVLPFRQLPLLEIDGLKLAQSQALVRYLARRANMDGATPQEKVQVDMLCETMKDVRGFAVSVPFATEEEQVALKERATTKVNAVFPVFEAMLTKTDDGLCFVASGTTVADILFAEAVHSLRGYVVSEAVFEAFPRCMELYNRIVASENIAAYLASDKRYPFPEGEVGVAYVNNVNTVLGR